MGESISDRQRQAAQNIAREKVLEVFENENVGAGGTSYGKTPETENDGKLKGGDPSELRVTKEQWEQYHTAWQDYYQKYYCNYYSNAARDYIAKERLKAEREKAEGGLASEDKKGPEGTTEAPKTGAEYVAKTLKERVREKANVEAKKVNKRRKYVPIFAGLAVVVLFLFLQYNRLIFAPIFAYMSPGNVPAEEIEPIDPTVKGNKVGPEPKLIIPKINVDVPVVFGIQNEDVMNAMTAGVAHFVIKGASAFPGQVGNMVITGHSAGDVYSDIQYKYIFSGLERLKAGDLIYVNYQSTRYTYKMTGSKIVEPTDIASLQIETDKPMLTLITCTPLGTSRYRLLVFAEQISPNIDSENRAEDIISESTVDMPANEKTFFEMIWDFITQNNN